MNNSRCPAVHSFSRTDGLKRCVSEIQKRIRSSRGNDGGDGDGLGGYTETRASIIRFDPTLRFVRLIEIRRTYVAPSERARTRV